MGNTFISTNSTAENENNGDWKNDEVALAAVLENARGPLPTRATHYLVYGGEWAEPEKKIYGLSPNDP